MDANLSTYSIRVLRQDPSLAPGGGNFPQLLKAFLPMVHGTISRLIPDDPVAAEKAVHATFETLAVRWRRLHRKTLLSVWLLRTAAFAAARSRRQMNLEPPADSSAAGQFRLALAQLFRLPPPAADAVVLRTVMGASAPDAAAAAGTSERRLEKRLRIGTMRIGAALRKFGAAEHPAVLLGGAAVPPPPDLEEAVLDAFRHWKPGAAKSVLTGATIWSWRWTNFRRSIARFAAAVVWCFFGVLAFGLTAGWLDAHFNGPGRNQRRRMAQHNPEVLEPAKPWPVTADDRALVSEREPATSAELYGLTNIWLARLSFTPAQWRNIRPSNIDRGQITAGGRPVLSNPNASRSGLSGVFGYEFNWTEGKLEFAGRTLPTVGVRYRGNGTFVNSLFGPKQSLKADLNKHTKGQKIAGLKELNFLNSIADDTYLRDVLAEQLFRDLGVPGPRTAYAYVTLDVPGEFDNQPLGLYVLMENIDEDYALDRFGSKKAPVFKPVTYEVFEYLGRDWKAYERTYDLKTEATPAQLQRVMDFAQLVTHGSDEEFERRLPEFLDIAEFAAFLAGHVLLSSYDGFLTNGQNYYVYLDPRSNKFGFISWDQDHSWGEFGYVSTAEKRENASIWHPGAYDHRFLNRVMKTGAFKAAYRQRLESALAELFTVERLYAQIDRMTPLIRPAIAAENDFRLRRFDEAVTATSTRRSRDHSAEGPHSPVRPMKLFIKNRIASVRSQLDGKSEGARLHWGR